MFYHIHTPDLLGWGKMSDIAIVLIELSELIGSGYDLIDTQDGLVEKWDSYFMVNILSSSQ